MFTRSESGAPTADAIPFFDDGWFHVFYLSPVDVTGDRGRSSWEHIRSRDLVQWESLPTALHPEDGTPDRDAIWTGSVHKHDGEYRAYYTARDLSAEIPQTIALATSADLISFTKQPDAVFPIPPSGWDGENWRDPYVFTGEDGHVHMTLSARRPTVTTDATGVVAISDATAGDQWSDARPLYEAGLTFCPECTDIRRLGDDLIMTFSTFSDRRGTTFRLSDRLEGEWRIPRNATPDGAWWYASKSLTDDAGRVITFGWVPDPSQTDDEDAILWGGDLALPREMWSPARDELAWRIPSEILAAFSETENVRLSEGMRVLDADTAGAVIRSLTEARFFTLSHRFDEPASLSEFLVTAAGHGRLSILIDTPDTLSSGLRLDLDFGESVAELRRVAPLGSGPNFRSSFMTHGFDGESAVRIQLVRRGTVIEFCVNDRTWFTARSTASERSLGFLVEGLDVELAVKVSTLPARAGR